MKNKFNALYESIRYLIKHKGFSKECLDNTCGHRSKIKYYTYMQPPLNAPFNLFLCDECLVQKVLLGYEYRVIYKFDWADRLRYFILRKYPAWTDMFPI